MSLRTIKRFDVRWYCIFDPVSYKEIPKIDCYFAAISPKHHCWGAPHRNLAFDNIEEGWCFCLDDDNILHPTFEKTLLNSIQEHPNKGVFVFGQVIWNDTYRVNAGRELRACPENIQVRYIDQAQYVIKRELLGDLRQIEAYGSDFVLIDQLWKSCPEQFQFVQDGYVYYNRLVDGPPVVFKESSLGAIKPPG